MSDNFNEKNNESSIKNLKIYSTKKRKCVLKKIKTIGLSILIGLGLFTGSALYNYNHYNNYTPSKPVQQTQQVANNQARLSNITGKYQSEYSDTVSSTPIVYDETVYNDFNEFIDNYQIEYLYPEVFHYEEAHEYYSQHELDKSIEHSGSGIIVNGQVDQAALLKAVLKNSPEFKTSGNHYLYQLIENEEELKIIIQYVAESINDDLPSKTEEEIREIDCNLADLKIFYGTGVQSARVTTDGSLLVNPAMIEAIRISEGIDEAYRNVMYHESKHIEQIDCIDHRNEQHYQQGISRTNSDLIIDPYTWTWAAEGGAEIGSVNMTGDKASTYNYLVGYMETLDLITITQGENYDGKGIERTTTNRDIQEFYRLMGVERGLSEEEIVRMMFAMEIVQSRVQNYPEIYEETYNASFEGNDMTEIRQTYRSQFLLESTKIFYNNLAERIQNEKDLTIEDIYALITIFEGDLNFHIKYNTGQTLELDYNQRLLQEYSNIQSKFFESISIANNMEYQDILDGFNNYQLFTIDNGETKLNASFNWLNENQISWLLNKATGSRISYSKPVNLVVTEDLIKSNSK